MNNQSAHGIKGLRTFPTQAANVISSVPVCAAGEEGECNLCAMGHYCPNAPKATAKPRVRVCLSWTASQLENEILRALLPTPDYIAEMQAMYAPVLDAMRGTQAPARTPKPAGASSSTLARAARHARNCASMVRS